MSALLSIAQQEWPVEVSTPFPWAVGRHHLLRCCLSSCLYLKKKKKGIQAALKAYNQIKLRSRNVPFLPCQNQPWLVQRQKTLFLTHGLKIRGGKRKKAHRPPCLEPHVRIKKRDEMFR